MARGGGPRDPREWLSPRPPDLHKYEAGHVLVVGGSRGMCGAPRLAALGALGAGAGLVTLGVPGSLEPVVAAGGPWECLTLALPDRAGVLSPAAAPIIKRFAVSRRVAALVLGPGLSAGAGARGLARSVLNAASVPVVLDADGLSALEPGSPRPAGLILTPHEGEMARLLSFPIERVRRDREGAARLAARRFHAVAVLKGRGTVITDGERLTVNPTGTPALATGGTGDVLAGAIAALIARVSGVSPAERLYRAAVLGAWLHGRAAESLSGPRGRPLFASDLARRLPDVLAPD